MAKKQILVEKELEYYDDVSFDCGRVILWKYDKSLPVEIFGIEELLENVGWRMTDGEWKLSGSDEPQESEQA